MEIKILQVFYGKDGLPYKDKERSVHFPIIGAAIQGSSNTTKIRFYFDELVSEDDETTSWIVVSKLPNGKIGSEIVETELDSELNEHYALFTLKNFYTQAKGDLFLSLQGYQGGVQVETDSYTGISQIVGTPTIQATGSIKLAINYATQLVGSGETANINFQKILADLGTKLGIRAYTERVTELPTTGQTNVFYAIYDDPNDPNKLNIYVWNETTKSYVWVGDNSLYLGNYYTQAEGENFENNIRLELQNVASGSPAGVYSTLQDLEDDTTADKTRIYLVGTNWYYWNGSAWTNGGVYLANDDVIVIPNGDDLNDYGNNGQYVIGIGSIVSNCPGTTTYSRWVQVIAYSAGAIIQICRNKVADGSYVVYTRRKTGTDWESWEKINFDGKPIITGYGDDLNDYIESGNYVAPSDSTLSNCPAVNTSVRWIRVIAYASNVLIQYVDGFDASGKPCFWVRRKDANVWGNWVLINQTVILIPNNSDLNDYKTSGNFVIGSSSTVSNCPSGNGNLRYVEVISYSDNIVLQKVNVKIANGIYETYIRRKSDETWENWEKVNLDGTAILIGTSDQDLNNYTKTGYYVLSGGNIMSNCPGDAATARWICVIAYSSGALIQFVGCQSNGKPALVMRRKDANTWGSWTIINDIKTMDVIPSGADLNDYTTKGWYIIGAGSSISHSVGPTTYGKYLEVQMYNAVSAVIQFLTVKLSDGVYQYYCRQKTANGWENWWQLNYDKIPSLITGSSDDLNNYTTTGNYLITANSVVAHSIGNNTLGRWVNVIAYNDNVVIQYLNANNGSNIIQYVRRKDGIAGWTNWEEINSENTPLFEMMSPAKSTRYIFGKGTRWKYLLDTVEAFTDAGKDSRCWGMTGDIQYTSDGYIVMYHDTTVQYQGNDVAISSLTLAQVQTIVLTEGGRNYSIPTIDDFLNICRKYGKVPVLETKPAGSWINTGHTTEFLSVIDKIKKLGMINRCMWICYGQDFEYLFANYHNKIAIITTYDQHIQDWETTRKAYYGNPYVLHAGYPEDENAPWTGGFTKAVMEEIHENGSYAIGYTPPTNAEDYIQTMIDLNYDAIILYAEPPEDE